MSAKPGKSKTVVLRLAPAALRTFPHKPAPSAPADAKTASSSSASSSSHPTPAPQAVEPAVDTPAEPDAASSSTINGTTTPNSLAQPAAGAGAGADAPAATTAAAAAAAAAAGTKRKTPAPKKRALAATEPADGTSKPRGKPGPKKKQKLGDMINDPNFKGPFAAPAPIQKLGPKANQGAINANLRSLDRTGKFKVRKWAKKGLSLRSFTGVVWSVPTYAAPPRAPAFAEDVKSDSTGGSSDTKLKDESSALSEKSAVNGSGSTAAPTPLDETASSPAPIAAGS